MTITQLKNFLIVAETLNFRKSSEQILIAQPALSRQVQQLEEETGVQLFDRSKKQVQLTVAGIYFKKEIERHLHQLEEIVRRTKKIHNGEAGEIHIGHASSAMQSVLPKLLSQLKIQMPGLKTVLTEGTNKLIFEKLLHRELDFGFVPNANPPKELNSKVIYKENFVLILPAKHRLSKKTFTSLAACADEDWVLPPQKEGFGYVEIVYRIFQNHGFLPKVVHESPNASSVLRLVEAGLGLNIMGKSALTGVQLDIKHIELTDIPEKIEMRLVWLKEREPELKKTIEIFSKYLKAK